MLAACPINVAHRMKPRHPAPVRRCSAVATRPASEASDLELNLYAYIYIYILYIYIYVHLHVHVCVDRHTMESCGRLEF